MSQPKRGTGSIFQRGSTYWIKYYRNGQPFREPAWKALEAMKGHPIDRTKVGENAAAAALKWRSGAITTGTFRGLEAERVRVCDLATDLFNDMEARMEPPTGNNLRREALLRAEHFKRDQKNLKDSKVRWEQHLAPTFGPVRVTQVTTRMVTEYMKERREEGAAPASVNRELALLKRMFNFGRESDPPRVTNVPKFPKPLDENNVRDGFVEPEEHHRLADAFNREGLWMRSLFECGYSFGWRVSELLPLRVWQVDLRRRTVTIPAGVTKNDEPRIVLMTATEPVYQLLLQCCQGKQPEDRVFTRPDGSPVLDFRDAWKRGCTAAGLGKLEWVCKSCSAPLPDYEPARGKKAKCSCGHTAKPEDKYEGLIFHDLRRTAVRNMVRSGISASVAMKISGHRTRSVFERYNICDERDLAAAALAREQYQKSQTQFLRPDEFGHNTGTKDQNTTPDAGDVKVFAVRVS